ncbi:MAG: demethoxyubiquinone hydroxylase family protein [Steroidobacter sp.]
MSATESTGLTQSTSLPDLGGRILKVNHAGEHGAIQIYTGQILMARFTARAMVAELAEFREHEQRHRAIFGAELQRRNRRRCRSYWLCGIGGFVLGTITGLCGKHAIAATTVAVERVVLRHLEHQVAILGSSDPSAVAAIHAIIEDEKLHHDQSASHVHAEGLWYKMLSPIVSASTEAVIWMGMRL